MAMTVQFPLVMKMQIEVPIDYKPGDTLGDIKTRIFNKFWEVMKAQVSKGQHGSASGVILKQGEVTVETGADMQRLISQNKTFQAIFNAPDHARSS